MNVEERVAHAVKVKTASLTVPVVDVDEVRRQGRHQQRRRTGLALAASSGLLAGTVWAVASHVGSHRSADPVYQSPSPFHPRRGG